MATIASAAAVVKFFLYELNIAEVVFMEGGSKVPIILQVKKKETHWIHLELHYILP